MRRTRLRGVSSRAGKPVRKWLQLSKGGVRTAEAPGEGIELEKRRPVGTVFKKHSSVCEWIGHPAICPRVSGGTASMEVLRVRKEPSFLEMMPNTSIH